MRIILLIMILGLRTAPALAAEIRDIKPPVDVPYGIAWIGVVLGLVLAGFLVRWALRFWLRRRAAAGAEQPQLSPWELAWERLEALQRQNLLALGRVKDYYVQLSDIVRHYLEDRFRLRAPEMTTEEFLHLLRDSAELQSPHKQALRDFLNACDMVKFAKYGATADEASAGLDFAKRLIEETRPQEGTDNAGR